MAFSLLVQWLENKIDPGFVPGEQDVGTGAAEAPAQPPPSCVTSGKWLCHYVLRILVLYNTGNYRTYLVKLLLRSSGECV